jgi:hypothetical protein
MNDVKRLLNTFPRSSRFQVFNLRLGFACNSSSTHSVVVFPPGLRPQADEAFDAERENFGWDPFTLVSPEAKRAYLYAQAMPSVSRAALRRAALEGLQPPTEPHWEARADGEFERSPRWREYDARIQQHRIEVLREVGGEDMGHLDSVDHESQVLMATTFDERHLFRPPFDDLKAVLADPEVVVLGGNDNGGAHHLAGREQRRVSTLRAEEAFVARDDGTHFTAFSRQNGTKLRFKNKEIVSLRRSATPELVDVKLTDYCEMDCAYCYQGSTRKGKHAHRGTVEAIIRGLASLETFEVAFGGGEPTLYPGFLELLQFTRELGIVPNFTTRNVDFLEANAAALKKVIGAVAISIDSSEDMSLATDRLQTTPVFDCVQWQVVHGACSTEELANIDRLREGRPLMLLGWKTTGRGASAKAKVCDWQKALRRWTAVAPPPDHREGPSNTAGWEALYIDTEFQRQFQKVLNQHGALSQTLGTPEGTFGCYIDAVNGVMGPSSYCEKRLMQRIEPMPSSEFLRAAWTMLSVDDARWAEGGVLG